MKLTDDGIFYFCGLVLIILCVGEPDLLDAIIHKVMQ